MKVTVRSKIVSAAVMGIVVGSIGTGVVSYKMFEKVTHNAETLLVMKDLEEVAPLINAYNENKISKESFLSRVKTLEETLPSSEEGMYRSSIEKLKGAMHDTTRH